MSFLTPVPDAMGASAAPGDGLLTQWTKLRDSFHKVAPLLQTLVDTRGAPTDTTVTPAAPLPTCRRPRGCLPRDSLSSLRPPVLFGYRHDDASGAADVAM
jgi:hypothetical protein